LKEFFRKQKEEVMVRNEMEKQIRLKEKCIVELREEMDVMR